MTKKYQPFLTLRFDNAHPQGSASTKITAPIQNATPVQSAASIQSADVLKVGAMHISGKAIANFNRTACCADYNYLEGDENEDELDNENEDEDNEIDEEVGQFFALDANEE
jgi:hypothetical protein